jgi:hypothetical protein
LNLKDANELLIERLWQMLLNIPKNIVTRESTSYENMIGKYILCRNLIELPTIVLPNEGILLPSHGKRIDYIRDNYESLSFSKVFGSQFPRVLNEAFKGKLKLQFKQSFEELYEKTFECFIKAVEYLLGVNFPELIFPKNNLKESILKYSSVLFDELSLKQKAIEGICVCKTVAQYGISRSLRWLIKHKKGLAMIFLMSMHLGLLQYLKGNKEKAKKELNDARQSLQKVYWGNVWQEEKSFSKEWFKLRRTFVSFMSKFYRHNIGKEQSFKSILKWSHE